MQTKTVKASGLVVTVTASQENPHRTPMQVTVTADRPDPKYGAMACAVPLAPFTSEGSPSEATERQKVAGKILISDDDFNETAAKLAKSLCQEFNRHVYVSTSSNKVTAELIAELIRKALAE